MSACSGRGRRGIVVPLGAVFAVLLIASLDEQTISLRPLKGHYMDLTVRKAVNDSAVALGSGGANTMDESSLGSRAHNGTAQIQDIEATATDVDPEEINRTPIKAPVSTLTTRNATLVIMQGGELGNHLQIFSMARIVQKVASEEGFSIAATWVVHHQPNRKWVRASRNVQKCFPRLQNLNFEAANTHEYDDVLLHAQTAWLGQENAMRLVVQHEDEEDVIRESLSYWRTLLDGEEPPLVNLTRPTPVFMPFLQVRGYVPLGLVDQYLDDIQDLFDFDYEACCKLRPDPDETVLHIRNFVKEMPRAGIRMGYEELSPNKTADELLGHLTEGDKVAILTRFAPSDVASYTGALHERGLRVRVISGQSDVEDFCFLLETQKELVGVYQSTFVRWAAYLGKSVAKARLYFIKSPSRRARLGEEGWYEDINWTHPLLKERVLLERYNSEAQDAQDASTRRNRRWLI